MAKQADVKFEDDFTFDGPIIGISGRRVQSITGFGSAFTEAAASVFAELPTSKQQELLKSRGQKLSLLASPWSPPAWMKSSGEMDGSSDVCLKDGLCPTWAKYMSKWISAYQAQGVPIWAITVQNEPGFAAPWEACKWSKDEETEFVGKDLGPTLRKDHPDVKIFAYDHNKDAALEWADSLLGDPTAS